MNQRWTLFFLIIVFTIYAPIIYLGIKIVNRIHYLNSIININEVDNKKQQNDRDSTNIIIPQICEYSQNGDTLTRIIDKSIIEYEVKPETKVIGTIAFKGCNNLKKVILPESIKEIQPSAFEDCLNLSEIILPNNLESISQFAFAGCTSLNRINIPQRVKYIGNNPFYGIISIDIQTNKNPNFEFTNNFLINKKLKTAISYVGREQTIEVPSNIEVIGEYTFAVNKNIKTINLTSIKEIRNYAFESCENLKHISFGKSLNKIGINPFLNIHGLSIEVNDNYSYRNGLLINQKDLSLICYCGNDSIIDLKDLTLPPNKQIKKINQHAFYNCTHLRQIEFNRQIEEISESAFDGYKNLSVYIHSNMKNKEKIINQLKAKYSNNIKIVEI